MTTLPAPVTRTALDEILQGYITTVYISVVVEELCSVPREPGLRLGQDHERDPRQDRAGHTVAGR